jgi:outer membrane biogenesis lipoprotein LolB
MRKSSLLSVLVVLLLGCASEGDTRDLTLATDTAPTFQQCRSYVLHAQLRRCDARTGWS